MIAGLAVIWVLSVLHNRKMALIVLGMFYFFLRQKEHWQRVSSRINILLAALVVFSFFINWGLELWRDAGKLASLIGPNGYLAFFNLLGDNEDSFRREYPV